MNDELDDVVDEPTQDEDWWRDYAECQSSNPDLFFTERGQSTAPAKAICRQCGVREECLAYALRTKQKFGIWGGLSERERRRIRKQEREAS